MNNNNELDLAEDMYRENIMEHFKNPQNKGEMKEPTVLHKEFNALCGDEIQLMLKIENKKIVDVKFTGHGCAISQASISMLTDEIKGKTLEEAKKLTKEDIFEMLSIPISAVRIKCAILSLDTLKNSIKIYEEYKK